MVFKFAVLCRLLPPMHPRNSCSSLHKEARICLQAAMSARNACTKKSKLCGSSRCLLQLLEHHLMLALLPQFQQFVFALRGGQPPQRMARQDSCSAMSAISRVPHGHTHHYVWAKMIKRALLAWAAVNPVIGRRGPVIGPT